MTVGEEVLGRCKIIEVRTTDVDVETVIETITEMSTEITIAMTIEMIILETSKYI